ncbi:L-seryl-tRNA(Sec) selenium transferase, partial [Serratia rubidaea]|nr:L-seryl-tRNA(Sec) selenium transferase [Serratia rubidaea]
MSTEAQSLYSRLPAIDRLLRDPAIAPLLASHGQTLIGELLRQMQAQARDAIKRQGRLPAWCDDWPQA